ncbi:VTT domain-containing protein [Granulicella tundricola]|uniref:Rhodanese domain protein n=1 Tax=Granulicella tundricola (strain ATCC BAA-1859 / DSM 23138 / MP5ACTX9) TaxID=1198114 RepID=E8X5F4_GRATM|nr:VTT domain-containing protein [Granulicella tundricola]ADW69501.1 Rhodanese domain protein [Granulicella tundricola MP5ACTX9]
MPIALVFFVHYAYAILFLWVLVEQMGVPIPSIPVLLMAGTLSATHRVSAVGALLMVLLACLAADSIWYALGRRFGNSVLQLLCRFSFEASTCVSKTEGYFHKRGAVTLLFAKFVPGLSTVAAPIAGQTGMPYPRFVLYDMGGSVIWALAYLLAGRFFGDVAQKSSKFFGMLGHFAVVIFVLMVFGIMLYRLWNQRKFLASVRSLRLEPAELYSMIEMAEEQGNIPPFIVDLRHPLDYLPDPRVLPGAVRVSPAELTAHQSLLPRDRDVILYCTCPSEETSGKVALQLHKFGINRVRPLLGGFEGWRDGGYPLVEYVPPAAAAELTNPVTAAPVGAVAS